MKKIKITEKQAELLGLNKIKENEDSGLKSVGVSIGEKIIRVVIEGDTVPKYKDRILQLIARQDPQANVGFFEATGKIVGNIKDIKFDSIKRDISALDPKIKMFNRPIVKSLKEGVKNIVKITKEQYSRIFGLEKTNESGGTTKVKLKENVKITGGLSRVDKTFKKEFAGKDIKGLKPTNESTEVPVETNNNLKNETLELIKYLYRKSEELSPFWEKNGLTYDEICDALLAKKLIVSKNGKYELPKSLGSPQAAVEALENELSTLIKPQDNPSPELETEDSGYPAGAAHDSSAPWNQSDSIAPASAPEIKLEPVAFNPEVIVLKDPEGGLYVFYYDNVDKKDFMQYASVPRSYVGKDDEGQPDYEYDFDKAEINSEVVGHYVNDNLDKLTKGEGLDAYESGVDLVKIDEPLKKELATLYDKDKNMAKVLGPIEEAGANNVKQDLTKALAPTTTPKIEKSKIVAKLQDLRSKEVERRNAEQTADASKEEVEEMTSASSSGAFTGPLGGEIVKREMPETPVVAELTVAGAGNFQYDTPGLANIGRNGEFKKGPKTKAEKTTQWAGGSFVEPPDCSKLNNNKSAEKGGCNSGASSLKIRKTGGSINAPSLGENEIYEAIAKKTGKSLDEVKKIIDSKKNKGV